MGTGNLPSAAGWRRLWGASSWIRMLFWKCAKGWMYAGFYEKAKIISRLERNLVIELTSRRNGNCCRRRHVLNPENLRRLASSGGDLSAATPERLRAAGHSANAAAAGRWRTCASAQQIRRLLEERRAVYGAVPWQVATDGCCRECGPDVAKVADGRGLCQRQISAPIRPPRIMISAGLTRV